jgi:hypothetical protein
VLTVAAHMGGRTLDAFNKYGLGDHRHLSTITGHCLPRRGTQKERETAKDLRATKLRFTRQKPPRGHL